MTDQRPNEDLFSDSRMSFGEHLEELRGTLVWSLIGIAIGTVIGFMLADQVVAFLNRPLEDAVKTFNDRKKMASYEQSLGYFPPEIQYKMDSASLAPRSAFIDPGQLIKAIQSVDPDALAKIDLTPYRFGGDSIMAADVPAVANRFVNLEIVDIQQRPLVSQLAQMLTSDERVQLQLLASGTIDSQNADKRKLLSILNRLIDQPSLHDSVAFQVFLKPSEWSLVDFFKPKQENQLARMKAKFAATEDLELSRRLNRVLVAKTFPGMVAMPSIDLVPIEIWERFGTNTQSLSPHEMFVVWLKAAVIVGLILSAPWVFIQIWLFVAKGLYPHEQKYIYIYLPISLLLFAAGVCMAFFFVFEPVLDFLFSFNASMGVTPQLRIGEWLNFVLFLPLGFGIAFQLPLVMLFLNRLGIFSTEVYLSKWRVAVMIIAVLSMLLTPADPMSMVLLGVPLTLLYFIGIGLCKWMPKPTNPFEDVAQA